MPPALHAQISAPLCEDYRQIRSGRDKDIENNVTHFVLSEALSARGGATFLQNLIMFLSLIGFLALGFLYPSQMSNGVHWVWGCLFCLTGILRLVSTAFVLKTDSEIINIDNDNLPFYTIMAALYKESAIVAQLINNLCQIHYPNHLLEIFILIEQDDLDTLKALHALDLPPHLKIIVVPEGHPKTKPRALNYGLARAKGEYVVVYDAEDRPDRNQLIRAVKAFAREDSRLICLQSPLRPVGAKSFLGKQFTLEYGLQFENFLPFLQKMGLPFPLGGTSNHFVTKTLRAIGGWDPYNVTEDADLGIRLARYGYRSALLDCPTYESAPHTLTQWLPQRTRWLKGHLQTLIVHLRTPWLLPPKALAGMGMSLGLGVFSSLFYAPLTIIYLNSLLIWCLMRIVPNLPAPPPFPLVDSLLFLVGNLSLIAALRISLAQRQCTISTWQCFGLPVYWSLQSLAGLFALHQLLIKPFHWDKTTHEPNETLETKTP